MSDFDAKGGGFSRRAVTIGGGIAVALGLAALGVTAPRLFGKHYHSTPYDDLFAQLVDRDAAVRLGHRALDEVGPNKLERMGGEASLVKEVRSRLGRGTLAQVAAADLAADRIAVIGGWVLPATLVLLSMLAALQER